MLLPGNHTQEEQEIVQNSFVPSTLPPSIPKITPFAGTTPPVDVHVLESAASEEAFEDLHLSPAKQLWVKIWELSNHRRTGWARNGTHTCTTFDLPLLIEQIKNKTPKPSETNPADSTNLSGSHKKTEPLVVRILVLPVRQRKWIPVHQKLPNMWHKFALGEFRMFGFYFTLG